MKKVLLALLLAATLAVPTPFTTRTNSFPNQDKHHAMLRLEDIGPGGYYDTPDDLGKLRTVFEYLAGEHVPFHVATISRSKYIQPDGTWHDKGIDDSNPDQSTRALIRLLKYAEDHGAVLGMHGYSHQYGDVARSDNNHISATAFEFNIKGVPESQTTSYAAEKIAKAIAAFQKAGLTPAFWETPHYHDNRDQEDVFRSYLGVLYQPDYRSLRTFKDISFYETENVQGRSSLGSVYIPAPLKYVQDHKSVDKILKRLPAYRGLASMYYHPFLEFPFLEPVKDAKGQPVLRDGLPEYRYKADVQSNLHRLVTGFRAQKYDWISMHDMLPFTPAHRVYLPLGVNASDLLVGDVSGSGHADVLVRVEGRLELFPGTYTLPRNRAQKPSRTMLSQHLGTDDVPVLADMNGDNLADLVLYNRRTGETRDLFSDGNEFTSGTLLGTMQTGIDKLIPVDLNDDGQTDFLLQKGGQLLVAFNQGGKLRPPEQVLDIPEGSTVLTGDADGDKRPDVFVYSAKDHTVNFYKNTGVGLADRTLVAAGQYPLDNPKHVSQLLASDTNGDGLTDLIVVDAENGIWQVLQAQAPQLPQNSDFRFQPLDNLYGPWARGSKRIALSADFDGNGKADIASFDPEQHLLDLSLSFRSGTK